MLRRIGLVFTAAMLLLPGQALAMGQERTDSNWRLWVVVTLGGLVFAAIAATGLYSWWVKRMRATAARLYAYLILLSLAALISVIGYAQLVAPIVDIAVYACALLFLVLFIAGMTTSRK